MSVSILEALQNAQINLQNLGADSHPIGRLAMMQLNNGIVLLEKGYPVETQVEPLLEKHHAVENVPDHL